MTGLKKGQIIAVSMSLAVHVAILSMPLMVRSLTPPQADAGVVTVELKQLPQSATESPPEVKSPEKPVRRETKREGTGGRFTEETVTLGSREIRYRDYLKKVQGRINSRWTYPGTAFAKGEKGVATVKFSIDSDGSLAQYFVMTSSGYSLLDECALNVIKAAAPYDPLPRAYRISRLHIIASFHYNLAH
jgi:periplasmic protein TonB